MKVALSLQRLASARQVKISSHKMIVPSQLIATGEDATQYAEHIGNVCFVDIARLNFCAKRQLPKIKKDRSGIFR